MAEAHGLIAVVVRYTEYDDAVPYQCVDLMRWYEDPAEADAEAARLNSVRRESAKSEYFVKLARPRRA